ncbi:MAG TPA: DUF1573 domain-containing protein [Parafilimonas sp.]|nr:DUF1573 domain-containing protein [Parafilimonas sp.]
MQYKGILICFVCMHLFACSNNKNPYENDLGIKPEHLAEIDTAHYTMIKWKDTLINFGSIRAHDSVNLKFEFTNVGKTLLFVFNTRTTCGCTITDAPKEPVSPGNSGFINVIFKSGNQTGEINKRIVVVTNTKNGHHSNLIIRGMIMQPGKKTDS